MRNYIALLLVGLIALACAKSKTGGPATGGLATRTPAVKAGASKGRRAEVLFLGHNSKHHDSGKYAPWLSIKLFKSGINMSYTVDPNDINPENLKKYDGLIIYANHDSLSPSQESAMKAFVEGR
jgi:hypothetical protein